MNDFSLRFIDALGNAENPAVRSMADGAIESHGAMRIDGQSQAGHPFCLTTESGREVIVALGLHWHAHFGELRVGADLEEPFAEVIQFLVDLVRERVIIVERYCGRRHLGLGVQRRVQKSPRPNGANRIVNMPLFDIYDGVSTPR
jgi:hypothetical protein